MQDQAVAKGEFFSIEHNSESVLHDGIAGDTPLFVPKNAGTMLAGCLSHRLIAVIPAGGGIREHTIPPGELEQIPAADSAAEAIHLHV